MHSNKPLKIDNPCPANWDYMASTEKGKFCNSCSKEVMDFTDKSDEEIRAYFLQSKGYNCGNFRADQLKDQKNINPSWKYTLRFTVLVFLAFLGLNVTPIQAQNKTEYDSAYTASLPGECKIEENITDGHEAEEKQYRSKSILQKMKRLLTFRRKRYIRGRY